MSRELVQIPQTLQPTLSFLHNVRAGKYVLQQGVVAEQATITAAAQEKLFPNRAALCHFFVDATDFDKERRLLERLIPAKHVPGQAPFQSETASGKFTFHAQM